MKKHMVWFLICAILIAVAPVFFTTSSLMEEEAVAADSEQLPVVGSYDNLKKLLKKEWENGNTIRYATLADMRTGSAPAASAPAASQSKSVQEAAVDYSSTNVQVKGVDEADVIKTDGTYLYQATNDEVRIIRAYPANSMQVVSRLPFSEKRFHPLELYVDDSRLIVIGHADHDRFRYDPSIAGYHLHKTTKAMVYDLKDKSNPKLTRELELEGQYLSSRKIGSNLYLAANKYIDLYTIMERDTEDPAPVYRDSALGESYQSIAYDKIRYFPEALKPDYLLVGGINLDKPKQGLQVSAYLGAGENVYASFENLYVATNVIVPTFREKAGISIVWDRQPPTQSDTHIYRFAMKDGSVTYSGKGVVPGRILNQFSMDEYKGHLRIATTSGDMWRTGEHTSKNNVYVLNSSLKIAGKLEGVAPGERIYSARFMGDRAYLVTFKKVDPLFVLDMKQPTDPKILGALKIPGYSDYLHPYDEHHIIGFGKDTVEEKDMALYQGMKVALFDVKDVSRPVEKFKELIGDRGTDSELLRNHKALLFSKEKKLLAFPVTLMQRSQSSSAQNSPREYGTFQFQGAMIYRLDLQSGFSLRGKITHLSEEDFKKAGDGWYESDKNVERVLYIGDTLYTISKGAVQAHQLSSLRLVKSLSLK
ncbi:beta-propeller domain-containing protein [Brevibacillus sp. H7]|uniref:beta-propeller domain-containing protein n=1 Tax=Brevibacillus sp. H7 TaxID=3349138 RepID=UPI0038097F9E